MRRWLKRIGIVLGMLAGLVLTVSAVIAYRASQVPGWYAQARSGPRVASRHSVDKLNVMQNWAQAARAGDVDSKPAADKRYTSVDFDADDINDIIAAWGGAAELKDKIEAHVKDIRVRLEDDRIIIAGESVEYGKIVSVIIRPGQGADGYATLTLAGIRVGEMDMPLVSLDSQQKKLSGALATLGSRQRDRLAIDDRGAASLETVSLYYTTLVADLLSGRSPDAYTFVALYQHPRSDHNALATRVRDIKLKSGKLTVTLELLTPAQRTAFLDRLRERTSP